MNVLYVNASVYLHIYKISTPVLHIHTLTDISTNTIVLFYI